MYPAGTILEIDRGWYRHIGVQLADGRVLHNDRVRGEEAVSIHIFSQGKNILAREPKSFNPIVFLERVGQILSKPKKYNLIANNCEHTVFRALYGAASSPQLVGYGAAAMFVGALLLSRKG